MAGTSRPADQQPEFFSTEVGAQIWQNGQARRARILASSTELMLDLAGVGPGSHVLDVAAGTGEQTLIAARRVVSTGSVLATDLSASMLKEAAEAAERADLSNVRTVVMDAQELDVQRESFDAAISRLGLMFLPDLARALGCILAALRPGGKFAAVVWGPADHNPVQMAGATMARRYGQVATGVLPEGQLFALGEPGVLTSALESAGFQAVVPQAVPSIRQYESASVAARDMLATAPLLSQARERLSLEEQERLLIDLEESLRSYQGPDGFQGPGEVIVGAGTK